ncbi:SDR family NAD(P)-dependent oxidoreductase [Blastococcus deserti]|uniref:SDR family NAD(P)-dependent oxidoreductase n=1 Tax=Blastococcus deserti TaxID=2259033 RepID=A0ABW4XFD0_9ACTN
MKRLQGRACVVTGGAAGIGEAIVVRLVEEGAHVAVADVDGERAQELAERLSGSDGEVLAGRVDVSVPSEVADFVERAAQAFGRLDGIVNNAGVAIPGSAEDISEADWDRVMSVNLKGVWAGMKYAIPHLRAAGGGSIVNMSSVQALVGFPGWAGYAATKGAILSLTQQAAVEYGPERIRVNCIAPGTIMTPMNQRIFETAPDPDSLIASWNASHALRRFGESAEVAAATAFLLSDDASFVTGTCLRVDGGLTVLGPSGQAT